jgi:hypothetical protein
LRWCPSPPTAAPHRWRSVSFEVAAVLAATPAPRSIRRQTDSPGLPPRVRACVQQPVHVPRATPRATHHPEQADLGGCVRNAARRPRGPQVSTLEPKTGVFSREDAYHLENRNERAPAAAPGALSCQAGRLGAPRIHGSAAQPRFRSMCPGAPPCTAIRRSIAVQGALTVGAASGSVKYRREASASNALHRPNRITKRLPARRLDPGIALVE